MQDGFNMQNLNAIVGRCTLDTRGIEMKKNKCDECELDLMHEKCDTKVAFLDAEVAALKSENAALRNRLHVAMDAIQWMSGSDDFAIEGKAREGFVKMVLPLLNPPKGGE